MQIDEILSRIEANDATLKEVVVDWGQAPQKAERLMLAVKASSTVTALTLHGMRDKEVRFLSETLTNNKSVTDLDLSQNKFGDSGAGFVNAMLKINKAIKRLNLSGNKFRALGVGYISEALEVNESLTDLNLSDNNLGTSGANSISKALKVNHTLRRLGLSNNKFGTPGRGFLGNVLKADVSRLKPWRDNASGALFLSEALAINESLMELDLAGNEFDASDVCFIRKILEDNKTIKRLNLSGNKFGVSGADGISEGMKTNGSLTNLELSDNGFGPDGAKLLAQMLKVNKTLERLVLYRNQFGPSGADSFSEALMINHTLTDLTLSANRFGPEGAGFISKALKVNNTLRRLNLRGNRFEPSGADSISEALASNESLTALFLSNNGFGPSGVDSISKALKANRTLTVLDLAKNGFGPPGVNALAEVLNDNRTIRCLILSGNQINETQERSIEDPLERRRQLYEAALKAAGDGDLSILNELLEKGVPLVTKDEEGNTFLHLALKGGHFHLAVELLKRGASLRLPNNQKQTSFDLVRERGQVHLLQFLIMSPSNHNNGGPPIEDCLAAEEASPPTLEQAKQIVRGYQQSATKNWEYRKKLAAYLAPYGGRLLRNVAEDGDTPLLKALKEIGFSVTQPQEDGTTLLHIAAKHERIEMVRYLMHQGLLNEQNQKGQAAIYTAALFGRLSAVKCLVEEGFCRLDLSDEDGILPLHCGAKEGHSEVVRYLVEAGASLAAEDNQGRTPLHWAMQAKKEVSAMLDFLEEAGADLEHRDCADRTPLHGAVLARNSEAVLRLAGRFNVSLDTKDCNGKTALELAEPSLLGRLEDIVKKQKKPVSSSTVRNLVFMGGGVKGIAYIGAIEDATQRHLIHLAKVKRVGGTSAGAITSFFLALGHLPASLKKEMSAIQFPDLLDSDDPQLKQILFDLKDKASEGLSWFQLFNVGLWKKGSQIFDVLRKETGLFKGEEFLKWIREKLKEATGDPNATFWDLHRLRAEKGFKDLYLVGVNAHTQKAETFCYEETPDVCIADAVRISMSIPFVFRPHYIHEKVYPNNQRVPMGGQRTKTGKVPYMDGGVSANYPLNLFDRAKYLDKSKRKGYERHIFNEETLGFRLVSLENYQATSADTKNQENSFFSFIGQVLSSIYHQQDSNYARSTDASRTVTIFNAGVSTLDVDVDDTKTENLISQGKRGVGDFIRKRDAQSQQSCSRSLSVSVDTLSRLAPFFDRFQLSSKGHVLTLENIQISKRRPDLVYSLFQSNNQQDRKLVQDLGIRIETVDPQTGFTALHLAVMDKNVSLLKDLIEAGISADHPSKSGTPLDLALQDDDGDVARELLECGAKKCQSQETLKNLLEKGSVSRRVLRHFEAQGLIERTDPASPVL